MRKTLGGDRLGSGKRMTVDTQNYGRSTHNLSYLWRSTISAGTLVPFMKKVALPGDTFEIHLDLDIKTHPTVGPLFGSFKAELDIFQIPFRYYNGQLHNNKLNIGMNMQDVKFPVMTMYVDPNAPVDTNQPDNAQVNPSSLLAYLGIRGVGIINNAEITNIEREFNAMAVLSYYDIFKNYYANKQEEIAYVIHSEYAVLVQTVDTIEIAGNVIPTTITPPGLNVSGNATTVEINYTGASPILNQIIFNTSTGQYPADIALMDVTDDLAGQITATWNGLRVGATWVQGWSYITNGDLIQRPIGLYPFALTNIDDMREYILTETRGASPFNIISDAGAMQPYSYILNWVNNLSPYMWGQEGLAVKTYMSDLYNNWLNEDWIDGLNGINAITAIDTTGGSFNVETLILAKKVYNMLNDIAVSGGTYDDYLDAVYDEERFTRAETPIYEGGLIKELVFQEVISNSQSQDDTTEVNQPLGTLGGRGVMSHNSKGGNITIKVQEPGYIMGIISLTPRIDYSQGNDWDIHLKSIDDLHKPALDAIGFQDLIEENMAWWTTTQPLGSGIWMQKSAGKQPAWLNYMTSVNQVRGNFAIPDNEMFMVLNRRYESVINTGSAAGIIKDLTTYIDPSKFNYCFAQTSIDSQNFWAQISVDITARRKMSAKIMPNL